jgi:hypothetical protein
MLGTLYVPSKARQQLEFGVEPKTRDAHTVTEGMVSPGSRSLAQLKALLPSLRRAVIQQKSI